MCDLFWLTEAQRELLQPYFPKSHCTPRVATQNNIGKELLAFEEQNHRIARRPTPRASAARVKLSCGAAASFLERHMAFLPSDTSA